MMWCVWGLSLGVWTGTGTLETHGQTVENTFTLLLSLRKREVFFHTAGYKMVGHIATGHWILMAVLKLKRE